MSLTQKTSGTTIKRFIPYLGGILVLVFLTRIAFTNGDFKALLEAAKLVAAGKNPYHVWIFVSEGNYDLYFYSPFWAVLLIPFTHLPNFIPNIIWLVANGWFLCRICILLAKYLEPHTIAGNKLRWILFLSILMSLRYILYNFEMIQMTIFLLWGSLESIDLFKKKYFLIGGAILALIINIKILPVVLIPWLIYRREWRGAVSTLGFSIVFLLLPSVILGWSPNLYLLSEWWSVINPGNTEHLAETDLGLHSLTALIPTLFTKTEGVLPYARNLFNLDASTTTAILNTSRAGLILFTLFFLRWPPFKQARSTLHELRELSYILLLIPLIFPHQQKYAFFLAFPAMFYISGFIVYNFRPAERKTSNLQYFAVLALFFLSFALMTLSSDGIIGRQLNLVTQHFKTITYGAVILIVILFILPAGLLQAPAQKSKQINT